MPKIPKPPITPKSSGPGKSIPKSQKNLAALDEKKPKTGTPEESPERHLSQENAPERRNDEEESASSADGNDEEDEENEDEEDEEDESQMEIAQSVKSASGLLSPEGVIFLPFAILLDLIGIILIIFALDDFFILDIIGATTIGIWIFSKTGVAPSAPESTGQKAENIAKKSQKAVEKVEKLAAKAGKSGRWLKPILCSLGEVIPYLGAIPFWTYLVYKTLTDND